MSGVEGLSRLDNAIEELREQLEATPLCTPVTIQKWAAEALLAAISAIEGGGGALQPSASVPTEQADGGVVAWRWRWQAGMYAHNGSGPGRWYYEDSQPSSATDHHKDIQPLYAAPLATPIAGDVLWLDRWADLERLAKAASAVVGQPDEEDWFMPQHFANLEPEDAAFIAATNPAAILELIAAARRDEGAGQ